MNNHSFNIIDPIDDDYLHHSQAAEGYVRALTVDILHRLGLWNLAHRAHDAKEIVQALNLLPERTYALEWLLFCASSSDYVTVRRNPDGDRLFYELDAPPPVDHLAQARSELAPSAHGVGSTTEMVDFVAVHYPEFLRGKKSGAAILFKGQGLERWEQYFSAANPLYQIHNQLGALGVQQVLQRLGRPARILELGTGTGGGTAALINTLQVRPDLVTELVLSDIAPSFLVRVIERLQVPEALMIRRQRLDFDRPFINQGIAPGSFDVIVEVNALHNCRDLGATLGWIQESLSPDGRLVLSESLCQNDRTVHQDLIFNLLPPTEQALSFAPERHGLTSRFFTSEQWSNLLDTNGLQVDGQRNAIGPELAWIALAQSALVAAAN